MRHFRSNLITSPRALQLFIDEKAENHADVSRQSLIRYFLNAEEGVYAGCVVFICFSMFTSIGLKTKSISLERTLRLNGSTD